MKREEGHVGMLEATMLVYASLSAKLYLQYPAYVVEISGPAAWQTVLVATAAALLLFWPVYLLARRFPGRGLAEISQEVGGGFLGPLVSVAIAGWFCFTLAITVRNFAETFIVAMLPNTPPSVLITVMMLCVAYASYRGLETLSRAALILLPLIIAGTALVLIFNVPRADGAKLFPFWGYGIPSTVMGGLWFSSMAAEMTLVIIFGYAFRRTCDLRAAGVSSLLLFGLSASVTVAVLVAVFGAPQAAKQPFPMFELARIVYMGRFLQRTEALLVMFWFFTAAVRLSTLFHAGVITLAEGLHLPYYRPLIPPLALLVVTGSLIPEDYISVLRLDRDWARPAGLFVTFLPLLLLLVALIRRKGDASHAA